MGYAAQRPEQGSPVRRLTSLPLPVPLVSSPWSGKQVLLRENVGRFLRFFSRLEAKITYLEREKVLSLSAIRDNVRELMAQIIRSESSKVDLEEGLPVFFHLLSAENSRRKVIHHLVNGFPIGEEEPRLFLHRARHCLRWYGRRRLTLFGLEESGLGERQASGVFGLSVLHDREWLGRAGFDVVFSAFLNAHAGEELVFAVRVEQNGKPVPVRDGWKEWSDGSGRNSIAGFLPFVPDRQQVIIDSVGIFLPYEALDLPEGRHTLDVRVDLCDLRGTVFLTERTSTALLAKARPEHARSLPSLHSLGLIDEDPILGNKISNLTACADGPRIKLTFDLELHRYGDSSEVTVEGRFLDSLGRTILLRGGAQSEWFSRLELRDSFPVERWDNLTLGCAVADLELEPGSHIVFGEVAVFSSKRKLLCGSLAAAEVEIAPEMKLDSKLLASFLNGHEPSCAEPWKKPSLFGRIFGKAQ